MIQDIGLHRVSCCPIQDLVLGELLQLEPVHILYSDPPWGDGNCKMWNTLRAKQNSTGRVSDITFDQLLGIYAEIIRNHVAGYAFIEVGLRQEVETLTMLESVLRSNVVVEELIYKSGSERRPNVILYGSTAKKEMPCLSLEGMTGQAVSRRCIEAVAEAGKVVLDPMCGMGYTAQAAIDNRMRFMGNEFSRYRLEKTIKRLS